MFCTGKRCTTLRDVWARTAGIVEEALISSEPSGASSTPHSWTFAVASGVHYRLESEQAFPVMLLLLFPRSSSDRRRFAQRGAPSLALHLGDAVPNGPHEHAEGRHQVLRARRVPSQGLLCRQGVGVRALCLCNGRVSAVSAHSVLCVKSCIPTQASLV